MGRRQRRAGLVAFVCLVGALVTGALPHTDAHAAPLGEPPRVETERQGEMRGVVTSAEDGLGLRQVRLVLRRGREVVSVLRTGKGGRFAFDSLDGGIYSIEAQAAGYLPRILAPITVRPGRDSRVEHITLTPARDGRAS